MSITRINTNYDALFARQNLQKVELSMNTSMARLSSGKRINSAADDPQSLVIIKLTEAQLRGNRVAQQNVQEAHAMFAYMDGIFNEVGDKLNAMRELAERGGNTSTMSTVERSSLKAEFNAIRSEIANITKLKWNDKLVFQSALSARYVQLGANTERIQLPTMPALSSDMAASPSITVCGVNMVISGGNFSGASETAIGTNLSAAISKLNSAIKYVANGQSTLGVYMRSMERALSEQTNQEVNNAATLGVIEDADLAEEISNFTHQQIIANAATAMLGQANAASQIIVSKLLG